MTTGAKPHPERCPLAAVDQRLDDAHRQWHDAEQAYFDPDAFRVAVQTVIQTLRTVTFILQANKRAIPDFEPWYQEWRDRLGADPLMRWMVEARNRIEKQGDLEAHSFVRAEIVASYLEEGPSIEVPAELFQSTAILLRNIPRNDLGEHMRKHGLLRVQRRWVENTLPDHELLDAVATAFGRISELVADAHRQAGLPPPMIRDERTGQKYPTAPGGRVPCMVAHGDARVVDFSLATGRRIEMVAKEVPVDLKAGKRFAKRYGIEPKNVFAGSGDVEKELHHLFETARKLTERDGNHVTIAFLYRSGNLAQIFPMAPETQADKYLLMRALANEAQRLGADAVIKIGEAWSALADPDKPYMRASEAADRHELLLATLVRKEGVPVQLSARFKRDGRSLKLEDTLEHRDGVEMMFAPLYAAWGREIPAEWLDVQRRARKP